MRVLPSSLVFSCCCALLLLSLGSTHAQELCQLGVARLVDCGGLNNGNNNATIPTALHAFVSPNCDYVFTVDWGNGASVNYVRNGTELLESDDNVTSLYYAELLYNYSVAGVYDISLTTQGYDDPIAFGAFPPMNFGYQISQTREDIAQVTIGQDGNCEDTTDSGAMSMLSRSLWSTALAVSVVAMAWMSL